MNDSTAPSERHYRFHLYRMALGLAFNVALGIGVTFGLMLPGNQLAFVAPALVFMVVSIALGIAVRRWPQHDAEERRLRADEWIRMNVERARKISLRTVWLAQAPLMFLVAYLPPDPTVGSSVVGMALLTLTLAGIGFFGSYLVFSRGLSDG
jgi:hypothetical protein